MNKLLICSVVFILLTACKTQSEPKHVILIGLDGWGAYSAEKAEMPVVKEMMNNGSWTLENRSVLPTSSACNWASAFMGAGPELHGYTTWGSKTPDLPSRVISKYGLFPSIFGLIRDKYPEAQTGCIYEWDGIGYLYEKEAVNYNFLVPDAKKNPEETIKYALKYIGENKPLFTAVIFDEPDGCGHKYGHDTPEYYEKLKELDGYISRIVELTKENGMFDHTVFIIMADHGGIDKGHGGKTPQELLTPFIVSGKGIKKGHQIQNSMVIYDIAATIAKIFKISTPQVWTGRPMTEIFE